jgi:hypothetical protein
MAGIVDAEDSGGGRSCGAVSNVSAVVALKHSHVATALLQFKSKRQTDDAAADNYRGWGGHGFILMASFCGSYGATSLSDELLSKFTCTVRPLRRSHSFCAMPKVKIAKPSTLWFG